MNENKQTRKVIRWQWFALVAIILLFAGRYALQYPRRGWCLKEGDVGTRASKQLKIDPQNIKHVILISLDTCRADHLSCYGYSRKTSPNIDAIAEDGVRFNHTVSPVPITLAAHSSMLTGMIPPYHKVRDNNNYWLNPDHLTLAEILKGNGFKTGAAIGAFVLDSQFGLNQGFDVYDDKISKKQDPTTLAYSERSGQAITDFAIQWLDKNKDDRSFLFLHYYDPHMPYVVHKQFTYSSLPFMPIKTDSYDSEIAYTDFCIGQVIDKLKKLNIYDATLLMITADHGESLGQHEEDTHSYYIYHSTLHVPLIFKVPGGPKGRIVNCVSGIIDIVPTTCGLLGLEMPQHIQGIDLTGTITGGPAAIANRSMYCESLYPTKFGVGPLLGMVTDRYKYIHTSNPELYDLLRDPDEQDNILKDNPKQAQLMKQKLAEILRDSGLTTVASGKTTVDKDTANRLRSLGYISNKSVNEGFTLDNMGADPREFIETYNFHDGFLKLAITKQYDKAKKLCNNMLEKHPDMIEAYHYLGLIAVYEKDFDSIITNYEKYLALAESTDHSSEMRIKPTHEMAIAHFYLAAAYQHKGDSDKCIAHNQKTIEYDPHITEAYYMLASEYHNQGQLDDAVKYYLQAIELAPEKPEPYFYMGNICFSRNEFAKAVQYYTKTLAIAPNFPHAAENLRAAKANAQMHPQ